MQNFYIKQKQPSRGVLIKRCSENMQQIYRRTPRTTIIEITLPYGRSPVNLMHIFRTPFTKNTSERLLLIKQKYIYLAIRAPFHTHFHVSIFYFSFNIVDSKVFLRHLFLLFFIFFTFKCTFLITFYNVSTKTRCAILNSFRFLSFKGICFWIFCI